MKKTILLLLVVINLAGCKNEDGSNPYTYNSCMIYESSALFAADRAKDVSQCWNIPNGGYTKQSLAVDWCAQKVYTYIGSEYLIGHSVKYKIQSTYCPAKK